MVPFLQLIAKEKGSCIIAILTLSARKNLTFFNLLPYKRYLDANFPTKIFNLT